MHLIKGIYEKSNRDRYSQHDNTMWMIYKSSNYGGVSGKHNSSERAITQRYKRGLIRKVTDNERLDRT